MVFAAVGRGMDPGLDNAGGPAYRTGTAGITRQASARRKVQKKSIQLTNPIYYSKQPPNPIVRTFSVRFMLDSQVIEL